MLNALIQNGNQTAVLELPSDPFTLQYELAQIGVRSRLRDIPIKDDEESPIRVKLFADSDIGNSLAVLFKPSHSLEDANLCAHMVENASPELLEELEQHIVHGQYHSPQAVMADIKAMTEELIGVTVSYYCPLQIHMTEEEYGDWYEVDNGCGIANEEAIRELVKREQEKDLHNMSTVMSRLNAFLDSEMEQVLCFDTAIDAEKFCNEKSAVFIVMPEENPNAYFMVSLLIQQLYREILAVADENGGKLPNRAMFYCDEFGTLPPIQSAEMMYSASRSRRLSIVSIIQSYQQLEKNYGKEGAAIIQDNCQLTIAGGFAPSSETADIISKALGTRTVMTGSVSRSKNDPSQSLQMTERPLMTADELKSMKKGSFIVMKTGAHPFISKLKLFFKWGISFPENSYTIADKGARRVHYISRETLIKNITARYPQEKKPRVPTASPPSGGLTMTEPAEATFAQEVNHAAQQEKIAKPMRTG